MSDQIFGGPPCELCYSLHPYHAPKCPNGPPSIEPHPNDSGQRWLSIVNHNLSDLVLVLNTCVVELEDKLIGEQVERTRLIGEVGNLQAENAELKERFKRMGAAMATELATEVKLQRNLNTAVRLGGQAVIALHLAGNTWYPVHHSSPYKTCMFPLCKEWREFLEEE